MKVDGTGATDDGDAGEGHYRSHPSGVVDDLHEAKGQRGGETGQGVAGIFRRFGHLAGCCLEEHHVQSWNWLLELEVSFGRVKK